jgi:sigma-B regulation protein RsbU (phosphoserine phosphatase)
MKKTNTASVKRPLVIRLIIWVGIPIVLVYGVVLILTYRWNREEALAQTKAYLVQLTSYNAERLNAQFSELSQAANSIANAINTLPELSIEDIYNLQRSSLLIDPDCDALGMAFEPYAFDSKRMFLAPYTMRTDDGFSQVDVSQSYDYTQRDWFMIPKLLEKAYWIEPFFGEVTQKLLTTFSEPVYRDGKFIGISFAVLSVEGLKRRVENIRIMGGYIYVATRTGTLVYHPNEDWVMTESIFSLAEQYQMPDVRAYGQHMIQGNPGIASCLDFTTGEKKWVVYAPIESCRWSFAAVIPESKILASVNKMVIRQSGVMLIGLLVIIAFMLWASVGISIPIRRLAGLTNELARGNLDVKVEGIHTRDEIRALADDFNKMAVELKKYIRDLTETTKAKEAVESELRIAHQIQESLLPRVFPPFPERNEFDLYARVVPAKDVAGDFYDFFLIDDTKLALIIADVSGKGVPAALFMAVTRTLMKIVCQENSNPAEALEAANAVLSADNDACMFTTLFLGIYDVSTGILEYANAGHNPPFIVSDKGEFHLIDSFKDIFLGIQEDFKYHSASIQLNPGDTLILYTDGVTEAVHAESEFYGMDRFVQLIQAHVAQSVQGIWQALDSDLVSYQGNYQADDITIMLFRRIS